MADVSKFRIQGLTAGTFTPFHENGDLNLPLIDTYVDKLVEDGVRNIFVCGTASEGTHLTIEERKLVAERWVRAGTDKLHNIIVHVGGNNLRESQILARHAQDIGASAISTLPTVFLRPKRIDDLADYLAELGRAAPDLPLYYYHIPSLSGVDLNMEALLDAVSDKVPTFRGMKFTAFDLQDFCRCLVHSNGKYDMLYGNDETIIASLVMGGKGFVGSTYNYTGKLCNKVIDAFNNGNLELARKETFRVQAVVSILKKYGGSISVNKCIMSLTRLDVGPPRLPFKQLSKDQKENLKEDLKNLGFSDLI
ncbi:N-acetylneuraminate lyase-like [Glandiceps talaboti]